ncbi:MAG: DNA polymerase III subunit gamma/tau [Thermodesulfobacteriota bacterium]
MSYLVLARKWRPQSFSEVVGQEAVVRILENGLARDRVAHAMIFSGVRGVGKTTLARIMAKALNCEGEGARPCNQCNTCREITAGTAVDIKEIDGASNRGIQEIRELKEDIRFFPVSCRFKVVIIDEVHMLTTEAFNALLKTLEEPPAHVYFMFATTEIHKVPITILSRCQRHELKRVAAPRLLQFFQEIAKVEEVDISTPSLALIAREADGSVRDGLSLLDQVFSFATAEEGKRLLVEDDDVVQLLGLVAGEVFARLAQAVFARDLATCLDILEQAYLAGVDLKRFAADLLAYFRGLLICHTSPKPGELLDVSADELATMEELAKGKSQESLYQLFHLFMTGLEQVHFATQPRLALELVLVRAMEAGQVVAAAELGQRLDKLLAASGGRLPPPDPAALSGQNARPLAPETPPPPQPAPKNPVKKKVPEQVAAAPGPAPTPVVPELPPEPMPAPPPPAQEEKGADRLHLDLCREWPGFVDYVKERQVWMAQSLQVCKSHEVDGEKLLINYENPSDCTLLSQPAKLKELTTYAQDFFQMDLSVAICAKEIAQEEGDGPSPRDERRALGQDSLVQMVTEIFDGQVVGIRTGPKFR